MMTFKATPASKAYVWIWLPNQSSPVVAGMIEKQNDRYLFTYGRHYRENVNAIRLSPFELPLELGTFAPTGMNTIHSCLRDSAPDAWGRRVISHEYPTLAADELDFMLLSGSNRIGALDFQSSSTEYVPRLSNHFNLDEMFYAAEMIEKGLPLPNELGQALLRGTSIGGARPKCLIQDQQKEYIAKFSLSTDLYDIIKAEYISMRLANLISLNVPPVHLKSVLGKTVLLVERFDRNKTAFGVTRNIILSGLSLLALNELEARYASYRNLADLIRQQFSAPTEDLTELYKRLIFNILIGNTDDHARNHSAFWDGIYLKLTPVYDLCPQPRAGREATQAMAIEGEEGNFSTLNNVLSVCERFLISKDQAKEMIEYQIAIINQNWKLLCEEANLPIIEQKKLWKNSIFNPFCFYDWK